MRRIRVLAVVYNPIAYDGRVQRECEALAEFADVELLCPAGPKPPDGLPFLVRPVRLTASSTIPRHLSFATALLRHARQSRPDLIHAHDYFMAGPGALAAAVSGARLIYDAHELIIPEPGRPMSRRAQFWYRIEAWAVRRAAIVIAANEERSRMMQQHYGLQELPLVIRNIPPPPTGPVTSGASALRSSRRERLCVYQGDVSLKRGLGHFLKAVPHLPAGIRLLIVGGGPDDSTVRQEIVRLGIEERVTMLGKVERVRLHAILRDCDVGLLCYPFEGLNNIYCAPNKIFEYAQAGLAVVTTGQPPLERILSRYDIGLAIGNNEEPRSIAAKIAHVAENAVAYRAGLSQLLSENTWTAEAERLRSAVSAVAAGHRSRRQ